MAKRRKGQRSKFGSVGQLESGNFRARYRDPKTKKPVSKTFNTENEGWNWLTSIEASQIEGRYRDPHTDRRTVGDYLQTWLGSKPFSSIKTERDYTDKVRLHITPYIGDVRLSKLNRPTIHEWEIALFSRYERPDLVGSPTVDKAWGVLRSALNDAVENGYLAANPMGRRSTPKAQKTTKEILTAENIMDIVSQIPEMYRLPYLLTLHLGCRKGEVSALTRSDVTFRDEYVSIRLNKQIQKIGKEFVDVSHTKTQTGMRGVHITDAGMIAELRAHIDALTDPSPDALLFTNRLGNPICESLYLAVKKAGEAIGRDDSNVKLLRTTSIALAAIHGAPDAELLRRFGHAGIDVSRQYYQQTTDEVGLEVSTRLADAINGQTNVVPLRSKRFA